MARPQDPPDERLARLARRQHGIVSRRDALTVGVTDSQLQTRVRAGQLERVRPGVFRIAGSVATWEQAVAGALASQPGSVASHGTAARLWGFEPAPPTEGIHLLAPTGSRSRGAGIVAHRSVHHDLHDLTRRLGLAVTTSARTLADCCDALGAEGTGRALDDLLRRGQVTLDEVRATAARLAGPHPRLLRPLGAALALRVEGYELADSDLEVRALRLIREAGLPAPVQQHPVLLAGRTHPYRLDLAYPWWMVAIELMGWAWHGNRSRFDRDSSRTSALVSAGWTVLPYTSETLDAQLVPELSRVLTRLAS